MRGRFRTGGGGGDGGGEGAPGWGAGLGTLPRRAGPARLLAGVAPGSDNANTQSFIITQLQ